MNVASLENVGNGARGLSEWRSREEAVAVVTSSQYFIAVVSCSSSRYSINYLVV